MHGEAIYSDGAVMALVTLAGGALGLLSRPGARPAPVAATAHAHQGHAHVEQGPDDHAGHAHAPAADPTQGGAHLPGGTLGWFLAFTAGFMLGAPLLHLLPEAMAISPGRAGLFALGGFLGIHLLERYVLVHPCGEAGCDFHTLGWAAAVGLLFCGAADGFALASASMAHVHTTGWMVFVAVAAHKVPEAFVMARLLLAGGRPPRTVMLAVIAFSLSTPLVAILARLLLGDAAAGVRSACLAISAGLMLAIATGDLLPEVHRRGPRRMDTLVAMLLGVGLMVLAGQLGHD
jgi:zinc and cadmium transporter